MTVKRKFSTEGFRVEVVGKGLPITPALETYVYEKIAKVQRFSPHILDIVVTLEVQRVAHKVSFVMKFSHFKIQAHAIVDDLYAAIDKASDKLCKLIRKYKSRLEDHHKKEVVAEEEKVGEKPIKEIDVDVDLVNDLIVEETLREEAEKLRLPEVIVEGRLPLKMLTQEEAIMKLDLAGTRFLLFREEKDQKLKLLYRQNGDPKFHLVEVQ